MKIKFKVILFFFIMGLLPILMFIVFSLKLIHDKHFNHEYEFYIGQLYQINSNLNTLFSDIGRHIEYLSNHPIVTVRDDRNFTNFLNADEKTFKYNISPKEQAIIDIFYSFLETHPIINSVYMGRENGSFVRSHPRPKPTKYDPRERPWYKLAKENLGKLVITKPYKSVTSDDINIGVVKALVDKQDNFYGVIGADVTLERLHSHILKLKLLKGSYIIIINNEGNILTHQDTEFLNKNMETLNIGNIGLIFKKTQGFFKFKRENEDSYLFFYTDEKTGWKICAIAPARIILKELENIEKLIFWGLVIIMLVAMVVSYLITESFFKPFEKFLKEMTTLVEKIKNDIPFEKINLKTNDEMQQMADAFNNMAVELKVAYNQLNDNYKRIKELDKLKSAFISMVSHELRTPLTIIKGSAVFLDKGKHTESAKKKELISIIRNNANRLQSIIDDLLDLSKIETGVFPVNKTRGNMTEILDKTIEELLPSITGKNIRILKRYKDEVLEWNFDNLRIIRVFNSILTNAVKFSPDNSEIIVDLKVVKGEEIEIPIYTESIIFLKNNYLLFSVADKGIGIEKQYQQKIFEKLFQIEDPLIRKFQGAGIGLSIAQGIVEAHDGVIWCESEGLNKGSTFYVLLPE